MYLYDKMAKLHTEIPDRLKKELEMMSEIHNVPQRLIVVTALREKIEKDSPKAVESLTSDT
ncbi:hypothetical protein DWB78_09705 [Halopelagius longus]|uniref:Uncharacterized protein n=2 Tax=Halopelagius longus TaxID=1236180 RepID=A0A1H0XNZ5_9EURY|nr:hypothetical protein DWB78_09705 [Halopelagius longus]SDQ04553.1 hypothetical protein SAMN05216278_0044 [Halopelagius longus]